MATTTYYLYPAALVSSSHWNYSAPASDVDDTVGAEDEWGSSAHFFARSSPEVANGDVFWSCGSPQLGLGTINFIKIHQWDAIGTAGPDQWDAYPNVYVAIKLNGVVYYSPATHDVINFYNFNTASWSNETGFQETVVTWTNSPATGTNWTIIELQNLLIGGVWNGGNLPGAGGNAPRYSITSEFIEVNADITSPSLETERQKSSTFLRLMRRPIRRVEVELPPEWADLNLLDNVALSHFAAPSPPSHGAGGTEAWKRRDLIVIGQSISPDTGRVRMSFLDARDFRCGLWSPLYNTLSASDQGDGIALVHGGGGRTFARSTTVYPERPQPLSAGETVRTYQPQVFGLRYEVAANRERWDRRGLGLFPGSQTQSHLYNTFGSGYSPTWTLFTGGGVGSWATKTDDFLWDTTATFRQCVQITQGASGSNSTGAFQAVTTTWTGLYGQVNVGIHVIAKGSSGFIDTWWRLFNSTDNLYWDDSAQAWTANNVGNRIDGSDVAGAYCWATSHPIPLPSGASRALQLFVVVGGVNDGAHGGNGSVVNIYCADLIYSSIRDTLCPKIPVYPITTTPVLLVRDQLYFSNQPGSRVWDAAQGTAMVTVLSETNHADMTDLDLQYVFSVIHRVSGGLNHDSVYYQRLSQGDGRFFFARSINGINYVCSSDVIQLSRGASYRLAMRWASTLGEIDNGVTPYGMRLTVNGTHSTITQATGPVAYGSEATDNRVYIGESYTSPAGVLGGYLSDLEIVPFVLTDEEIARRQT